MAANDVTLKVHFDYRDFERGITEACVAILVESGMDRLEAERRVAERSAARIREIPADAPAWRAEITGPENLTDQDVRRLFPNIKHVSRAEACAEDAHDEIETTRLGQADREFRCTRCGNLRTEPREDRA